MKARYQYLIILAMAVFFTACKKTNTQGRLIPSDAAIAVQVDGKALLSKLSWAEIKDNQLFQAIYSDTNLQATVKKLLDDPEKAGIDIHNDILLFTKKDSTGGYVAIEGSVKDAALLKTFNAEITNNGSESETDGVHYISHAPLCAGWTNEKFVYVIDAPGLKGMDDLSRRMMNDSIDIGRPMPRDIITTCKAVFGLKESSSLAQDEKFTKLMKQPGDVRLWINSEALSGSAVGMAAMVNLDKLYKGNITTFAASFDNGKITMNGHSYAGEDLTKLYKKYGGGKVNEDMLKRIPGKDMVAVVGLNFKPEGVKEFLKMLNLDGLLNIGLTSLGFGMDDFIKANKGDIVFGISDLQLKTDTSSHGMDQATDLPVHSRMKPDFNFVFSASIGDKDAFNKFINAGKKLGDKFVNDNTLPIAYNSNGNYFVLSNSKENADKYLAGANASSDFISKISGQAFGGFLNIQAAMKPFANEASKDSVDKAMYDASLKMWDHILWKGGDIEDGAITQSIEINLLDKTTNSLKQLNQYTNELGKLQKEKQKKQKEDIMAFEDAISPGSLKEK
jgi:Domain of unknown function (DUF4836)